MINEMVFYHVPIQSDGLGADGRLSWHLINTYIDWPEVALQSPVMPIGCPPDWIPH